MRQDVTGFFTMLQGPRAWGGDSGPGRGVGIRAQGAGWGGDSGPGAQRRGGAGFGPGRGVEWGFGPGGDDVVGRDGDFFLG